MKLVCLGDSLTTGYGVFKGDSWVEIIKNSLDISIINKGVNGDTTTGMLSRSYTDVVENNPTHVIIMGGCNDFMANRSLSMVKENMSELVNEAIKHKILPIIGIEPPIDKILAQRKWSESVDYDKINSLHENYRQWILTLAKENNIAFIDFFNCFKETLKIKTPKELYVDGLHPTATGHKLMADCVIQVFKAYSNK